MPSARRRYAVSSSGSIDLATQRGSADSIPSTSSRPSRPRRSGSVGSSWAPSSQAPRPRHAHHFSDGPKSYTNANATSAIVCPSATAIDSA